MNGIRTSLYRYLTVGVTATALCSALAGCATSATSGSAVIVSTAAPQSLAIAPAGTGPVLADVDHAVVVERRATVTSVDVTEGEEVHLGEELLKVYTIGDSGAVATAINRLRADQKQLESVRARDGVGAASTITLLAQVAQDRQALTNLKSSPTLITAPADGRVSGLSVEVGEELTRTDVVMHVVDARRLKVTVPVSVTYSTLISAGLNGIISIPGYSGQSFASTVTSVGPSVIPGEGDDVSIHADTFPVTVELANPASAIPLGSTAYIRFALDHRAPVAVNSLAVLGSDQQPFVFVVSDGRVEQRAVATGVSDGSSTEILSGLKSGEDVVISGGQHLISGDQVQPSRSDSS